MGKVCADCKAEKSAACFHKSKRNGRQSVCRLCRRKKDRERYLKHPRKKELNYQRRKDRAEFVLEYKRNCGCLYCPECDPCCLDFHHIDDKIEAIAAIKHSWSMDRLLAEMKKCEVVCSNCHRKIHAGKFCPMGVTNSTSVFETEGKSLTLL